MADLKSIRDRLSLYDQVHVLAHWHKLNEDQQRSLEAEIASLDLDVVRSLFQDRY